MAFFKYSIGRKVALFKTIFLKMIKCPTGFSTLQKNKFTFLTFKTQTNRDFSFRDFVLRGKLVRFFFTTFWGRPKLSGCPKVDCPRNDPRKFRVRVVCYPTTLITGRPEKGDDCAAANGSDQHTLGQGEIKRHNSFSCTYSTDTWPERGRTLRFCTSLLFEWEFSDPESNVKCTVRVEKEKEINDKERTRQCEKREGECVCVYVCVRVRV